MVHRVIGGGAVADAHQDSGLIRLQLRGGLAEIIAAGRLDPIAVVAIEVGIAVKFHDVRFGIFLLHLRGQ